MIILIKNMFQYLLGPESLSCLKEMIRIVLDSRAQAIVSWNDENFQYHSLRR